ncbi:MAG TPA: FlgD immunoglobulin-like domain containing protein [bacterium]|nr:FlgD immunoglobulin-like domain containing protein [bacterium]
MTNVCLSKPWLRVWAVVIFCLALGILTAALAAGPTAPPTPSPYIIDFNTKVDANNISMYVCNLGAFAYARSGTNFEYPKGSGKYCLYSSGLWVGAKVNGQTRVTVCGYTPEYRPGVIHPDGTYDPYTDPIYHVYKIVRGDTASTDYTEWPAQQGAPVNSAGKPLLTGDQTLWCVYHDADPQYHTSLEGGTAPLGIEVQQTIFAFDWQIAMGNVIYLRLKVINKLANTLTDTYFGIWADPDIGGAGDDFAGCDAAENLGFAYNGGAYDSQYGSQAPCLGYDLLKGPRGDGGSDLGMTSFAVYASGQDPISAAVSYRLLQGLSGGGFPIIDPTTGNPTTYMLSGDPDAGTGWLDSHPGDRRFIVGSGPFTMAPGDTQVVDLAIVAARGWNRVVSVRQMKVLDRAAQAAYDAGFAGMFLPGSPATSLDAASQKGGGDDVRAEYNSRPLDQPAGSPDIRLAAGPCPARGAVTISFEAAKGDAPSLRIIDAAGRLVRVLDARSREGTRAEVQWDGRNSAGESVPGGIYWVCLSARGHAEAAKIVMLR